MKTTIRSECSRDIAPIAAINYNAFLGWHPDNPYVSEPVIVDMLRHGSSFDPDLSLVAESDGVMTGHALFYPFRAIVRGTEQRGVVLGPIAVQPKVQKTGIGGLLIEEGHRRALDKGYSFSLLCGHRSYYPRFGYRTAMFSFSGSRLKLAGSGGGRLTLKERPVFDSDIEWLCGLWKTFYSKVPLALFPGSKVCDWTNHSPLYRASVLMSGGTPVGYVRYPAGQPGAVREMLPADAGSFNAIVGYMAAKAAERDTQWLSLPLALDTIQAYMGSSSGFEDCRAVDAAFMIKVLDQRAIIAEYCDAVAGGALKPGILVLPVFYDVDDGVTH
jgi:putative acetyltransferase